MSWVTAANVLVKMLEIKGAYGDVKAVHDYTKKMAKAVTTLGQISKSTEDAGERIAGIVRSLRNFARLDEAEVNALQRGNELGHGETLWRDIYEVELTCSQLGFDPALGGSRE